MPLIKSISGIRGTIGGSPGDSFTPLDIIKFTSSYSSFIKKRAGLKNRYKVIVGRDARISGEMVENLVCGTLSACGIDVVKAGLCTTPATEMAVTFEKADGGIILTASHNPKEWNALKLLNEKGEFLNAQDGQDILESVAKEDFQFSSVENIGIITQKEFTAKHIEAVLSHPLVDTEAIYRKSFTVVVDAVNSVGSTAIPMLLESLGVNVIKLNCEPNGRFPHNPEPLPEHLTDLSATVVKENAHLGIAVDPDVDRLAIVCEDGNPFGEEYTLVAVADYVLDKIKGPAVSNMSSSMALKDIAVKHGQEYFSSAVGEVNVVTEMKRVGAVIGGEGNGGVIVPDLHYGRDALIGTALFLSHLAKMDCSAAELRSLYPQYHMIKRRVELPKNNNKQSIFDNIKEKYSSEKITDTDGVKIEFKSSKSWVHLRASNTEPILRVYAEAPDQKSSEEIVERIINDINKLI